MEKIGKVLSQGSHIIPFMVIAWMTRLSGLEFCCRFHRNWNPSFSICEAWFSNDLWTVLWFFHFAFDSPQASRLLLSLDLLSFLYFLPPSLSLLTDTLIKGNLEKQRGMKFVVSDGSAVWHQGQERGRLHVRWYMVQSEHVHSADNPTEFVKETFEDHSEWAISVEW